MPATRPSARRIWHRMLEIHAEQVFTIGIVIGRAAAGRRRTTGCATCPTKALYNWDPGAYFGIYQPDTFWFDAPDRVRHS